MNPEITSRMISEAHRLPLGSCTGLDDQVIKGREPVLTLDSIKLSPRLSPYLGIHVRLTPVELSVSGVCKAEAFSSVWKAQLGSNS